jgi:uncharacterized protein (DUF952 family)
VGAIDDIGKRRVPIELDFVRGTTLFREADRRSDLPIVRNGPPGTFVVFPGGLRVSLPTDQIIHSDDESGRARVTLGGMRFDGRVADTLLFTRVRELCPEEQLSPDRSHTMTLAPEWVAAIKVDGRHAWSSLVYKIVPAQFWNGVETAGVFAGSPVDKRDGFIHFSAASQVSETASRHFAGQTDLLLVTVSAASLDLRWEPSRGGDCFPHLYGKLPIAAVRSVRPLPLDEQGRYVFPLLE